MITHLFVARHGSLHAPGPLRQRLLAFGKESHLRGNILLSARGVQVSVVGPAEQVARLLEKLRSQPGLEAIEGRLRALHYQPFKRLVVRVTEDITESVVDDLDCVESTGMMPACGACLAATLGPRSGESGGLVNRDSEMTCPECGERPLARRALVLEERQRRMRAAVTPLPGRQPFDHFKPVRIPPESDGGTLLEALCSMVPHVPAIEWGRECDRGRLVDAGYQVVTSDHGVRAGEEYWHQFPGVLEPDVDGGVILLHEDEALAVLNKPAPLPMHAGGRYFRNTLVHILNAAYYPQTPRPAHRLDANTTGIVVVARTRLFAGLLQAQFARGEVKKHYLVRVEGTPALDQFQCDAPIGSTSGVLGSRAVDLAGGRPAHTEFRVLQRGSDGTTLLEARPLTGRTHQIRVHLWHLGLPVCGDPLYQRGHRLGQVPTLAIGDPPLCLHAGRIEFVHPLIRTPVEFRAPAPAWVKAQ